MAAEVKCLLRRGTKNKSNFTAKAVRVEANLLGTSTVIEQFLLQTNKKKMFELDNEGRRDAAEFNIYKSHYTFFASFHYLQDICIWNSFILQI